MKRILVGVLTLMLVGAFLGTSAVAKKPKKTTRTAEGRYEASIATNPGAGPFWVGSPIGTFLLPISRSGWVNAMYP